MPASSKACDPARAKAWESALDEVYQGKILAEAPGAEREPVKQ